METSLELSLYKSYICMEVDGYLDTKIKDYFKNTAESGTPSVGSTVRFTFKASSDLGLKFLFLNICISVCISKYRQHLSVEGINYWKAQHLLLNSNA